MKDIIGKQVYSLLERHCSGRTITIFSLGFYGIIFIWFIVGCFKLGNHLNDCGFWAAIASTFAVVIGIIVSYLFDVKFKYYDNRIIMAMKPNEGKTPMQRWYAKQHKWKILRQTEEDKLRIQNINNEHENRTWLASEIEDIKRRHAKY
jgi:hypothetical protein